MFVSRDQLAQRPIRTKVVEIPPEFGGGKLKLRALKQAEREQLDDEALEKTYAEDGTVKVKVNNRGFQAKALAMSMVNEDLSPYFATLEEGVAFVSALDDKLFDILFAPVDEMNVLTVNARAALGKDSAPSPSSSSSAASPPSGAASSRS
jgi:hypothetical protein